MIMIMITIMTGIRITELSRERRRTAPAPQNLDVSWTQAQKRGTRSQDMPASNGVT